MNGISQSQRLFPRRRLGPESTHDETTSRLIPKQLANVWESLYQPVIATTKLSICLQYLSIFVLSREKKFWYLQTFIWINMLYFATVLFVTVFQCNPRAKIWNPEIPGACLDYYAVILSTGIFNVVSDIFMLVFPLICIWNLQMSIKRKIGVSAIFFIGSV